MNSELTIDIEKKQQTKVPLIYKILIVLGMMSVMAGSLTGVMTYMNLGYTDSFAADWLGSFVSAVCVMPFGFALMSLVTNQVNHLMPNTSEIRRNVITGLIMACLMESIMAFATATNNIGFSEPSAFLTGWLNGFLAALPLGMVLVITMSLTIKPKIERILKS
ncbi:DUF2798 domain-containing protein [Vibrio tapetis]|uniref:DUF2798 domain-containing protein n=1 Tax=Vibrio tapetis subsp. tapetis TaxID=1671868 RepID=A0A2N8ZJ94_9VIBR|nr:DUF2798 domain-containing protein [Vibrio tapetis]SON51994.1 conserved membrane protein of unknown function [Vibrio tapetis subsp. tapetis]